MSRTMFLAAMLALFVAPAFAQDGTLLKVGDDFAEISPPNWLNTPTFGSLAELKGDVIVLKAWGIN